MDFLFSFNIQGETLSADFRKLNPFGGVPFIDDDGFILPER